MATVKRNDAKDQIMDILSQQGYPTYAKLLNLFDVYLTDDPEVIGYMIPGKAKIVLNGGLNTDQVSTIVRHEILHEYFVHGPRKDQFQKDHPELGDNHQLSNIAGDYDISNKGYTEADKKTVRNIRLGDKTLSGLVTEDQHPDWVGLSYEEMYEKLLQEMQKNKEELQQEMDKCDSVSKKDVDDLQDDIDNAKGSSSSSQDKDSKQQKSSNSSGSSDEQSEQDADKSDDGNGSAGKKMDDLSNELDKIGDELDKLDGSKEGESNNKRSSNAGGASSDKDKTPIDTPEEQKARDELAKRVAEIKKAFEDAKQQQKIEQEAQQAKRRENNKKEAQKIDRINRSGISKFKLSLNKFISNQIEEEDEDSYARENPTYADTDYIMPGRIRRENKHIPIINVYWDVSGSFDNPAKTAAARNAIGTLNTYVRSGDIEIHTFYFADHVSDTQSGAGMGTNGEPVVQHIIDTKPDNVIIITDGDTSDQRLPSVQVPGAVWMLFYDNESDALKTHVRGKRENKAFLVDY